MLVDVRRGDDSEYTEMMVAIAFSISSKLSCYYNYTRLSRSENTEKYEGFTQ